MPPFRLGLFGGTFDPPHLGHLLVAQDAAEQLGLDRLLLVVAGLPPHKLGEEISPPETRLEMARAAVEGNPLLIASDVELDRDGPTFTVDTLRGFRSTHPEAELFFLLGADQLAEFHEWQDPEAILGLATLVAMDREGIDPGNLPSVQIGSGTRLEYRTLSVPRVDISASDIRDRVREGRSIEYMVPTEVRKIIERNRLYRSNP